MKLSEAIRLGAMMHPQHFGDMHEFGDDGRGNRIIIGSCALGAALDAGWAEDATMGGDPVIKSLMGWYPCPQCHLSYYQSHNINAAAFPPFLLCVIVHLNDSHHWTRERIADWVELLENKTLTDESKKDESLSHDRTACYSSSFVG